MPRPKRDTAPESNAIISSAARLSVRTGKGIPKKASQEWQDEAWRFIDVIGEAAFVALWQANALSRVRLTLTWINGEGQPVSMEDVTGDEAAVPLAAAARAVLAELFGGEAGQEQMMSAAAFNLFAPGEFYLVGLPTPKAGIDTWRVLSNNEISSQAGTWVIDRGDGAAERYREANPSDPEQEPELLVIRIWRPHPRMGIEATSPVRAALPILRELEGLSEHVGASIDSRLDGAGILLVPQEITFSTPVDGQAPEDPQADPFLVAIVEAMEAAKADRSSAAARAPIVVRAPAAYIGNVQHISFSTPFSEAAKDLREEAIRRLALSLDIPPEVLLGQSDSNHWSAWLISEDAIKVHVEPLVNLITHSLTTQYLWPALAGMGDVTDEIRRFRIVGDTSALRLRPSRTAEAMALHDKNVITDEALARETGFSEGDLLDPTSDEMRRRLLAKIANGVTTADLTNAALKQLGVDLTPQSAEAPTSSTEVVVGETVEGTPPVPAIEAPREIPAQVAAAIMQDPVRRDRLAGLMASAELLCGRALERANSRLGNRGKNRRPITDSDALANAMHDAWDSVPRVATLHHVPPEALHAACSVYVRGRMLTASDHDPQRLLHYLLPLVAEDDSDA